MKFGFYCNWGLVNYNDSYYIPSVHKKYLDVAKALFGEVILICSVRNSIPPSGFDRIIAGQFTIIELPYFNSYASAIPHFFSIAKAFWKTAYKLDFIYVRTPEPFSWLLRIFNRKGRVNYHFASNPLDVILKDDRLAKPKRYLKFIAFYPEYILICFAAYFGTATSNGASVITHVPFFLKKKMKVLYESTIFAEEFLTKCYREIAVEDKIKFLTVSRLQPGKGLHLLLDAFASLVSSLRLDLSWELTIAGDGPMTNELKEYAVSLNLDKRVNFVGFIPNGLELDNLYSAHDVCIMPSLSETGPRVIIEAMKESNFCIASNVGYVSELLGENRGLVIPPGNPGALKDSIVWVFNNRNEAAARAHKGFQFSQKYSIESFFENLMRD